MSTTRKHLDQLAKLKGHVADKNAHAQFIFFLNTLAKEKEETTRNEILNNADVQDVFVSIINKFVIFHEIDEDGRNCHFKPHDKFIAIFRAKNISREHFPIIEETFNHPSIKQKLQRESYMLGDSPGKDLCDLIGEHKNAHKGGGIKQNFKKLGSATSTTVAPASAKATDTAKELKQAVMPKKTEDEKAKKSKTPSPPKSPNTSSMPTPQKPASLIDEATLAKFKRIDSVSNGAYKSFVEILNIHNEFQGNKRDLLFDRYCGPKTIEIISHLFAHREDLHSLAANLVFVGEIKPELLQNLAGILGLQDFRNDLLLSYPTLFNNGKNADADVRDLWDKLVNHFNGSAVIPRPGTLSRNPSLMSLPKSTPTKAVENVAGSPLPSAQPNVLPVVNPLKFNPATNPFAAAVQTTEEASAKVKPLAATPVKLPTASPQATKAFDPSVNVFKQRAEEMRLKREASEAKIKQTEAEKQLAAQKAAAENAEQDKTAAEVRAANSKAAVERGKLKPLAPAPLAPLVAPANVTVLSVSAPANPALKNAGPPAPTSQPPPLPPKSPPPAVLPIVGEARPAPQPPTAAAVAKLLSSFKTPMELLADKVANLTGPAFVLAGNEYDAVKANSNVNRDSFVKPVSDLNDALKTLIKDLNEDFAAQKKAGKNQLEMDSSSANVVCQKTTKLIDTLASSASYADKLAAAVTYKQECIKSSPGRTVLKALGAVAIAAVSFAFVAACAIAGGVGLGIITLPTGPGVIGGVLTGIATGATWAITILSSAGGIGLGAGAGSAYGFLSPNPRERHISQVAEAAKGFIASSKP
jgi:hypothetical protein